MREKTLCLPTDAYHLLGSRHLIPVVHVRDLLLPLLSATIDIFS